MQLSGLAQVSMTSNNVSAYFRLQRYHATKVTRLAPALTNFKEEMQNATSFVEKQTDEC